MLTPPTIIKLVKVVTRDLPAPLTTVVDGTTWHALKHGVTAYDTVTYTRTMRTINDT
jgi:hypothetical protein